MVASLSRHRGQWRAANVTMNTVERLEAMTDEGEFELLATAILAKANPLYASVLHLGINASGKTIPSPIDGFCLVPPGLSCSNIRPRLDPTCAKSG